MSRRHVAKLLVVGTAAGAFSGLFGVGGGTVIVPFLVFWFAYGEREASGTSLAAIVIIASVAAALQGAYGNVDVGKAALVGLPAVGGVVLGTHVQQRIHTEWINFIFAALLVAVAVELVAQ
jgi:uncharacterized protein